MVVSKHFDMFAYTPETSKDRSPTWLSFAGKKGTEVDRLQTPVFFFHESAEAKSQAQHGGDSYRPWGMGWGCEGGQGKMEVGFEGKRWFFHIFLCYVRDSPEKIARLIWFASPFGKANLRELIHPNRWIQEMCFGCIWHVFIGMLTWEYLTDSFQISLFDTMAGFWIVISFSI